MKEDEHDNRCGKDSEHIVGFPGIKRLPRESKVKIVSVS